MTVSPVSTSRTPLRHVSKQQTKTNKQTNKEPTTQPTNQPRNIRQSAVSELDVLKLGNEVEAEANDVRPDKTKVDQSAGILGVMEIERLRYAAGQAAGSQARPRSPHPDSAVKMAEKEAALAGVKAEVVN